MILGTAAGLSATGPGRVTRTRGPLRRWAAVLAIVAVSAAGCAVPAAGQPDPEETTNQAQVPVEEDRSISLTGPGGDRTATVFHPPTAGPGAPLVVVLHGAGGDGEIIRDVVNIDDRARREGFVVAYPDALGNRWNAGRCCRGPNMTAVDDVAFLHDLRALLITEDQVDPGRVYSMGMSNGGMLSYTWACDRPQDLAGIGVVAATLVTDCPDPTPLTVVAVHGTADMVVPLAGGVERNRPVLSLDATLAPFRTAAGCPPEPVVDELRTSTVSVWTCESGDSVVRAVLDGARHVWPGSERSNRRDTEGPRSATDFIWERLATSESS